MPKAEHDVPVYVDADDDVIDFSNAVLYVGALQTIFATVAASLVSILSCWLLPAWATSAVRTLMLSSVTAALLIRKPFRLGRVHGLGIIFNALRPCVAIYVASMVLEQLVHTCTRDSAAPSWRRMVFHCSIVVAMGSGFARARRPLEQTDVPFLLTGVSLFVIAMLPPPAVVLSGPLCSEPSLNSSVERLTRSFVFSLLYCTFVYASAPPVQSSGEVLVCVMRASAASLWVLGCHLLLLPLSAVQAAMVIYVRIYSDEYQLSEVLPLMQSDDDEFDDVESAGEHRRHHAAHAPASPECGGGGGACEPLYDAEASTCAPVAAAFGVPTPMNTNLDLISPAFSAVGARGLVDISAVTPDATAAAAAAGSGAGMSRERMAAIAAQMTFEGGGS